LTPVNNQNNNQNTILNAQGNIPSPDNNQNKIDKNKLNDIEKRLDETHKLIKTHLDEIAKIKSDPGYVPLQTLVENVKNETTTNINNLNSIITKQDEQLKTYDNTIKQQYTNIINENNKSITNLKSDLLGKVTTLSEDVTTNLNLIKKNQSTLTERMNGYVDLVSDLGTISGKVRLLKYLAFGGASLGGVGCIIGLYALRRVGPKVIAKIKEHRSPDYQPDYTDHRPPVTDYRHVPRTYKNYTEKVVQNDAQHLEDIEYPVNAPKQVLRPKSNYYPYETNQFQQAYERACASAIKKYPGQELVLTHLDSIIQQELNGAINAGN